MKHLSVLEPGENNFLAFLKLLDIILCNNKYGRKHMCENEIKLLESVMDDVQKYFLNDKQTYVVCNDYLYMRDAIILYTKQHKLIKSALLLMKNNMNEEAMVLSRSALNNYFLIGYILNDPNMKHFQEYHIQPVISDLFQLKNIKEVMKRPLWKDMVKSGQKLPFTEKEVDNRIHEAQEIIIKSGFHKNQKPLSIKKLAECADERGLELYITKYINGSRYEHSDISCLDVYKRKIDEYFPDGEKFILDMDQTDEQLEDEIISTIKISYRESFKLLLREITEKKPQLKKEYNEQNLINIMNIMLLF